MQLPHSVPLTRLSMIDLTWSCLHKQGCSQAFLKFQMSAILFLLYSPEMLYKRRRPLSKEPAASSPQILHLQNITSINFIQKGGTILRKKDSTMNVLFAVVLAAMVLSQHSTLAQVDYCDYTREGSPELRNVLQNVSQETFTNLKTLLEGLRAQNQLVVSMQALQPCNAITDIAGYNYATLNIFCSVQCFPKQLRALATLKC